MKLPLTFERHTETSRDVRAGCFECWGRIAKWTAPNAQALAAKHHDRTGHATWCDVHMTVRYGRVAPDARQTDIEDAIVSASSDDVADSAAPIDLEAPAG